MKSVINFKSDSGNEYVYNRTLNRFQYCHPVLTHLREKSKENIDIKSWVDQLPEGSVDIGNGNIYSKEDFQYYYRKSLFLEENGFFSDSEIDSPLDGRFSGPEIKKTLANTRQITFEVTDACNLKCLYCGYGHFYDNYDQRQNKRLSVAVAKNILKYLAELWNSNLNISHDAKIFLSSDLLTSTIFA